MNFSSVDSNRFQLNIFRDNIDEISPALWQELFQQKVDIAILRLPTKKQHTLHHFDAMGIPFVVADTLVEYSIKAHNKVSKLMNPSMKVYEPGSEADWQEVDIMVEKCFTGYSNHYFSNPYLDKTGNIEGYKEWVRSCQKENGAVFIVEHNGAKAGFFSLAFKDGIAHGAPGGIIPEYEASGLYLDFHKLLPSLIQQKGLQLLRTSTQVQNLTVQRQWTMAGWNFTSSALTIHLNVFIDSAMKGIVSEREFQHKHILDFILENLGDRPFQQLRFQQIELPESGKKYEFRQGEPIKNVMDNGFCRSLIIAKDERLIAIAWIFE